MEGIAAIEPSPPPRWLESWPQARLFTPSTPACSRPAPSPSPPPGWSQHVHRPRHAVRPAVRHGVPFPARGRALRRRDRILVADRAAPRRRFARRAHHARPDRFARHRAGGDGGGRRRLDDPGWPPDRAAPWPCEKLWRPVRRRSRNLRRFGGAGDRLGAAARRQQRARHDPHRRHHHGAIELLCHDPLSSVC